MSDKNKKPDFLLRIATPSGVIYEQFIVYVKVIKKDGVMILNRNYSPILEQLKDGEIFIKERSKTVRVRILNSWVTVNQNKCNVFSSEAEII